MPCYCGEDLEEGARLLEPLRRFGPPIADLVAPMPYVVMQQMLDAACPYGIHSYWKSNFMSDLTDDGIDTFVELRAAGHRREPLPSSSTITDKLSASHPTRPLSRFARKRSIW